MMSSTLDGRGVVVTGGTGGLGAAVVQAFLDAGATCWVPERGRSVPERGPGAPERGPTAPGRGGGTPEPPPWAGHPRVRVTPGVDLTDERRVAEFYGAVPDLWASVHAAGGFAFAPILETSLDLLRKQIDLNLVTCFLCCREAVRVLRAGGRGGRIVNVSSRPVELSAAGLSAYAASKAAVASLTRTLAEELRPEGILVNAVVPSIIDTPATRRAMPKADHGKWPKPEEIARTILFLASPENVLTWGGLVPVYGEG